MFDEVFVFAVAHHTVGAQAIEPSVARERMKRFEAGWACGAQRHVVVVAIGCHLIDPTDVVAYSERLPAVAFKALPLFAAQHFQTADEGETAAFLHRLSRGEGVACRHSAPSQSFVGCIGFAEQRIGGIGRGTGGVPRLCALRLKQPEFHLAHQVGHGHVVDLGRGRGEALEGFDGESLGGDAVARPAGEGAFGVEGAAHLFRNNGVLDEALQRQSGFGVVGRSGQNHRHAALAVHGEFFTLFRSEAEEVAHLVRVCAPENAVEVEVAEVPFADAGVGMFAHFGHTLLRDLVEIVEGTLQHGVRLGAAGEGVDASEESGDFTRNPRRRLHAAPPAPAPFALLLLGEAGDEVFTSHIDFLVGELRVGAQHCSDFEAVEGGGYVRGRTVVGHLEELRHHLGHFGTGVTAGVDGQLWLHTAFERCEQLLAGGSELGVVVFTALHGEGHSVGQFDAAGENGKFSLFTVAELRAFGHHTSHEPTQAVGHFVGKSVVQGRTCGEVKLLRECLERTLRFGIDEREEYFALGTLLAEVVHGDGNFGAVALAEEAWQSGFGRKQFAHHHFVGKQTCVELRIVGQGVEVPLCQAFGKGEAEGHHPLGVGVKTREEEGRFVEVLAQLHRGGSFFLFCCRLLGRSSHKLFISEIGNVCSAPYPHFAHHFAHRYLKGGDADFFIEHIRRDAAAGVVEHHRFPLREVVGRQLAVMRVVPEGERRRVDALLLPIAHGTAAPEGVSERCPTAFGKSIERGIVEMGHHVGLGRRTIGTEHPERPLLGAAGLEV